MAGLSCFYLPIVEASVSPMGLNSLSCKDKSISVSRSERIRRHREGHRGLTPGHLGQ